MKEYTKQKSKKVISYQKAEDRKQKAEGGGQKAESRRSKLNTSRFSF